MSSSARRTPESTAAPVQAFALLWQAWEARGFDGETSGPTTVQGRPDPWSFLDQTPAATSLDRLAVLLIDLQQRWRRGESPSVETYLLRAPDLAGDPRLARELVLGEWRARCQRGEKLDPQDFLDRFPQLAIDPDRAVGPNEVAQLTATRDPVEDPTIVDRSEAFRVVTTATDGVRPGSLLRTTKAASGEETDGGLLAIPADGVLSPTPSETIELGEDVRFSILSRLGDGGMGVVYMAFDRQRRETVALKVMRRVDPAALYRFKQEFRSLADLTHPNLVNLFELVAARDLWFYTMEVVPGIDLVRHVRGNLNPGEALDEPLLERLFLAMRQLSEGVNALHEAGKLHRDIKPTNILVTPSGRVVLLDFGLAADLGRAGIHQADAGDDEVVGTVAYMAPEQAAGRPLTRSSDWYSVGVVLHEALTGRLPFDGSLAQVLSNKQSLDPVPPSALVTGIPPALDSLCRSLLARDPTDRPDGRAVIAALGRDSSPGDHSTAHADGRGSTRRVNGPCEPHGSTDVLSTCHDGDSGVSLIGRESHRRMLWEALAEVREGRPVVLLVSGRSGSGKSVLIESFLAELAREEDVVVLRGRCYERESVPFKVLDSAIDALSRYLGALDGEDMKRILPDDIALLARMFPVLRRVGAIARAIREGPEIYDDQNARRRAIAALCDLLRRISDRRTVVLSVDDLQWGDADSAALIEDLLRPPSAPALLFLGAYRLEDADASPLVRSLRSAVPIAASVADRSDSALVRREVLVDALTSSEARSLALALLGRSDSTARARGHLIARESRGNPYYIAELVKHVQVVATPDEEPTARLLDVPGLDDVIWTRVARLPDPARRLLEVVAVSGRPVGLYDALEAADIARDGRTLAAILRSGRLIRGTGTPDEIEIYHEWVRSTIMARLAPDALRARHLQLAEVLETAGRTDPQTLGALFLGAGLPERAVSHFIEAAEQASTSLAFMHAARLYRLALEHRRDHPDSRTGRDLETLHLRSRLGDVLAAAGHGREAALVFREAANADGVTAAQRLDLRRREATQWLLSGHVGVGLAVLRKLPGSLTRTEPDARIGPLASLLWKRLRLVLRPGGLRFKARDASQVSPEDLARIDLCWSAGAGLSIIDPLRGADFHARALLRALRAGEPYRVARSLALEACHAALPSGRCRRFDGLLARVEGLARELDHPHLNGLVYLAQALAALSDGEWRAACLDLDRAEPFFRDRCQGVAWELDTLQNFRLMALTNLGEVGALRRLVSELLQDARDRGDLYAIATLGTEHVVKVRLAEGEPDEAQRAIVDAMTFWPRTGFHIQHGGALRASIAIDLYRGQYLDAWNRMTAAWPAYRRSMNGRIALIRIEQVEARGRVAMAASDLLPESRTLLRLAERCAASLDNERPAWSHAHAALLRAGLGWRREGPEIGARLFLDAAERYQALGMVLHEAVARFRASRLARGADAAIAYTQAVATLESLGVRRPVPFVNVLAPEPQREAETDSGTGARQQR